MLRRRGLQSGALTVGALQSWGAAISAQDAGRLAWALAAMDALQEEAVLALAPQLSMLGPDDTASLAALFQVRNLVHLIRSVPLLADGRQRSGATGAAYERRLCMFKWRPSPSGTHISD